MIKPQYYYECEEHRIPLICQLNIQCIPFDYTIIYRSA